MFELSFKWGKYNVKRTSVPKRAGLSHVLHLFLWNNLPAALRDIDLLSNFMENL